MHMSWVLAPRGDGKRIKGSKGRFGSAGIREHVSGQGRYANPPALLRRCVATDMLTCATCNTCQSGATWSRRGTARACAWEEAPNISLLNCPCPTWYHYSKSRPRAEITTSNKLSALGLANPLRDRYLMPKDPESNERSCPPVACACS